MKEDHEKGIPIMKILLYECLEDSTCWEIEDQYLYGRDILVAPVLSANSKSRKLYLPEGEWVEYEAKKVYKRNQWIEVKTPIDEIPVFVRKRKEIL